MNAVQTAYVNAKSEYRAAIVASGEFTAPYYEDENVTDEQLVAIEVEAEEKFNTEGLRTAYRMAENALIEWAHDQIKVHSLYHNNRAIILTLFESLNNNPSIRERIVELATRLES